MKKLSSIAISFSLVVLFVSVMGVSTSKKVFASSPLGATNLSAAETYTEDTPLNLIDIVVTDGSSPNVTAALTVSNTSAGTLSTMTSGTVTSTYNASTGVWTATGATADVNVLLAGVTFTPALNFNGSFSIATSVSDGINPAATGSKSMTGVAVNDPPTATNLSTAETYTEDTPLNLVDIVASDVDSATLTVTLSLSAPGAGTLSTATSNAVTSTYNAGTGVWTASGALADVNTLLAGVTFTPTANYNANFTIATNVSDGILSIGGVKTMTGVAVNDAPILDASRSPALSTINKNAPAPVGAVGTLVATLVDFATPSGQVDNVTDIDTGASLGIAITGADTTHATYYYSTDSGVTWNLLGAVSNTSARLLAANESDRIYVKPTFGYNGAIVTALTFRAWDQTSGTNGSLASTASTGGTTAFSIATDTAGITITNTNNAPVAVDDFYTVDANTVPITLGVLENDIDFDTDTLSLSSVATPAHGSASISSTNVLYAPTADYCGSDTFEYVVSDGTGTDTGTVVVTVNCIAPSAPLSLSATTLSTNQITLSWSAPVHNGGVTVTGYKIERESPIGGGFGVIVADTGSTGTSYSDGGLNSNTQYNYRVSAINSVDSGSASSAANATTLPVRQGAPIFFTHQNQTLQADLTSSKAHPIVVTFTKNLKKGMDDASVAELQKFLDTHGFPVATTGQGSLDNLSTYFGSKTKNALMRYQASVGLNATGYFGPLTQAYINKMIAGEQN